MSISPELVSLALILIYLTIDITGKKFKESFLGRMSELSGRSRLRRSKRKAERAFRYEQRAVNLAIKNEHKRIKREQKKNARKKKNIRCPDCKIALTIPASYVGDARCPECNRLFSASKFTRRSPKVDNTVDQLHMQVQPRDSRGRFTKRKVRKKTPPPSHPRSAGVKPPTPPPKLSSLGIASGLHIHNARLQWAVDAYTEVLVNDGMNPEAARIMSLKHYKQLLGGAWPSKEISRK